MEPEKQQPFNPLHRTSNIPQTAKKYHLSSHDADHYRRSQSVISSSKHKQQLAPSSNNLSPAHDWEEDSVHNVELQSPASSTSSSLHMQELLSQLASSISAMTTAFAQVQTSLNTYDIFGHDSSTSAIENFMVEREFQRLLDLHIGLHSLVQQYEKEEGKTENKCTICNGATMDENMKSMMEKKNATLKSYESIITRFMDEIRTKDAVTHALKETLAKSLLRGEKLEKRIKALEMKMSSRST